MQAMATCVDKLNSVESGLPRPDFILIDGNRLPSDIPEAKARSVVKVVSYFSLSNYCLFDKANMCNLLLVAQSAFK